MLIQSDLFVLERGCLTYNPARAMKDPPLVRLGESFTLLEDYFSRFRGIPNMLELISLFVDGDVYFEEDVTLKGNITITSRNGRITIPQGSVLKDYQLEQ